MQYYQPGSVILLMLPFSDATTFKRRPALVLLDTGDNDIVVSRITTQIYNTDFDVEILEWQQAGLMRPSVVRLHKLNTLSKSLVDRILGTLQPNDW
jgi:mRNA interferase MazF